jgi:hypothetical protein
MELRNRKVDRTPISGRKRAPRTHKPIRDSTEEESKEKLLLASDAERVEVYVGLEDKETPEDVAGQEAEDDDVGDDVQESPQQDDDDDTPRSTHDLSDEPTNSSSSVVKTPGFAWEEEFLDFLYKPHTITGLGLALVAWVYFAYTRNDRESVETNFKAYATPIHFNPIHGFCLFLIQTPSHLLCVLLFGLFWLVVCSILLEDWSP